MRSLLRTALCIAFLPGAMAAAGVARAADALTIYRCVDPKGGVALQDFPCPRDAHQDVRQMIRPQDASPRPVTTAASTPAPLVVREVRYRQPPAQFECRTPDGQTYTNETGIPGGRYVPIWTYGYNSGIGGRGRQASRQAGPPAMTYEQDTCVRQSPDDACKSLRDRREELGNLIFNAQAGDRERYEHEQKSVDAQLQSDCSGD